MGDIGVATGMEMVDAPVMNGDGQSWEPLHDVAEDGQRREVDEKVTFQVDSCFDGSTCMPTHMPMSMHMHTHTYQCMCPYRSHYTYAYANILHQPPRACAGDIGVATGMEMVDVGMVDVSSLLFPGVCACPAGRSTMHIR